MKIKKLQNLKKKIDRQIEVQQEKETIALMTAFFTKSQAIGASPVFAYMWLKEQGFDVGYRPNFDKSPYTKMGIRLSCDITYKNQRLTPKGLRPLKRKFSMRGHSMRLDMTRAELHTVCKATLSEVENFFASMVLGGVDAFMETSGYKQYRDAVRGWDAKGHAVHRLVARSDSQLTYDKALKILRTHDMTEPVIHGMEVRFNNAGQLATIF